MNKVNQYFFNFFLGIRIGSICRWPGTVLLKMVGHCWIRNFKKIAKRPESRIRRGKCCIYVHMAVIDENQVYSVHSE